MALQFLGTAGIACAALVAGTRAGSLAFSTRRPLVANCPVGRHAWKPGMLDGFRQRSQQSLVGVSCNHCTEYVPLHTTLSTCTMQRNLDAKIVDEHGKSTQHNGILGYFAYCKTWVTPCHALSRRTCLLQVAEGQQVSASHFRSAPSGAFLRNFLVCIV